MTPINFLPASRFDLAALARLYTRTFEGYVYKAVITPELLASFIHVEDLKMALSPVMRVGETPVGFATVGLRGTHAYCRGFGVIPEYRGKGLALPLCDEMTRRARGAGAHDMTLGVLMDNLGAVKTYERGGFTPTRELHSVEWTGAGASTTADSPNEGIVETEPQRVLDCYDELHTVPATWNRDLPSLRKMTDVRAQAIFREGAPSAYILFRAYAAGSEIVDLGWVRSDDALTLVRDLQAQNSIPARPITCFNEPADSPSLAVLTACTFVLTHRRYEMRAELRGQD